MHIRIITRHVYDTDTSIDTIERNGSSLRPVKYILGSIKRLGGGTDYVLFIFSNQQIHADIAHNYNIKPTAAGFIEVQDEAIVPYGCSESLAFNHRGRHTTTEAVVQLMSMIDGNTALPSYLDVDDSLFTTLFPQAETAALTTKVDIDDEADDIVTYMRDTPAATKHPSPTATKRATHAANGKKLSWIQRRKQRS